MLTMSTMKYPNIAGGNNMAVSGNGNHVDDVDSIFPSSCWQNSSSGVNNDFMDTQKLILDGSIHSLASDKILLDASLTQTNEISSKTTMDVLDNLLNPNLHELKPLPPFAGYTGHLSINGIQGHHYHAIAHRLSEENNNNYSSYNEQNSLVSSSTCNLSTDDDCGTKPNMFDEVVKVEYADCVNPDSVSGSKMYNECNQPNSVSQVKSEMSEYDIASIDISTLIGTAIADTKVVNNVNEGEDASGSRDSWMDLDAWFEEECNDQQKSIIITHDGLSEFSIQNSPQNNVEYSKPQVEYSPKNSSQQQQSGSTLQTLLTHGYMPLLQNRLQNGPPIKQEMSNNSNYGMENSTSSPPAVVSTTDNLILSVNGRFMHHYNIHGLNDERIGSPDLMGQNYPHATTTTPNTTKKSRSRSQKKQQMASSTVFQAEQNLGLIGKEKPVHRCSICNRGFLNKSNIKVHLRTHTGEKPFRCETCAKAFRQKAHLLKHQQIHKRIGRD